MEKKVKNFRIDGYFTRQKRQQKFTRYVRALDREKALEKFFSTVNVSKSRAEITVTGVKQITASEISNERLRKIAVKEKPSILRGG